MHTRIALEVIVQTSQQDLADVAASAGVEFT
ncbi:hypothetical protein NSTC731_05328 [Nostoc sp. DSM 114167]|jgi:hypothetical protein